MTADMSNDERPELAGPVIAEVVAKELDTLRSTRSSLQSRGLAVITSSGTLVTLLFGLSALTTEAEGFVLPSDTHLPLALGAVLLVLASVAGILTTVPRKAEEVDLDDLDGLIEPELWEAPKTNASQAVASMQLSAAKSHREKNTTIARILLAATSLEIAGVACVMWAVIALVARG